MLVLTSVKDCGLHTHSSPVHATVRVLPSKRPSPYNRPPPIFDDPMVSVYTCVCVIRTNGFSVYVSAHPRFLAVNFKRPWALTRKITVIGSPRSVSLQQRACASPGSVSVWTALSHQLSTLWMETSTSDFTFFFFLYTYTLSCPASWMVLGDLLTHPNIN